MNAVGHPTAIIANGASVSDRIQVQDGCTVLGFITDSAWDTNAISFLVSAEDPQSLVELVSVTFLPLYIASGEATIAAVAASRAYVLDSSWLRGWNWFQVRSGTAAAPVNQTGQTVITLAMGQSV